MIDTSPQAGVDWLLHAYREMNINDLIPSYKAAIELVEITEAEALDGAEDVKSEDSSAPVKAGAKKSTMTPQVRRQRAEHIIALLRPRLQWRCNVPAGVGSGRADVTHKGHALLHSERLTQPSWRLAARALNNCFSITSDLGTESRFHKLVFPLSQILGTWATDSDRAEFDSSISNTLPEEAGSQFFAQPESSQFMVHLTQLQISQHLQQCQQPLCCLLCLEMMTDPQHSQNGVSFLASRKRPGSQNARTFLMTLFFLIMQKFLKGPKF